MNLEFNYTDGTKYSNCCGARDRMIYGDDASYSDYDICPECKEHCDWITIQEMEEGQ
jgi:hypothetical protein